MNSLAPQPNASSGLEQQRNSVCSSLTAALHDESDDSDVDEPIDDDIKQIAASNLEAVSNVAEETRLKLQREVHMTIDGS